MKNLNPIRWLFPRPVHLPVLNKVTVKIDKSFVTKNGHCVFCLNRLGQKTDKDGVQVLDKNGQPWQHPDAHHHDTTRPCPWLATVYGRPLPADLTDGEANLLTLAYQPVA